LVGGKLGNKNLSPSMGSTETETKMGKVNKKRPSLGIGRHDPY